MLDVHRIRRRLLEIVEAGHSGDRASLYFDSFVITLIILNVLAFALQTVETFNARYGTFLEWFNIVSVLIFTVEYLTRLWVCVELPPLRHLRPSIARLKFMFRPLLLVDLLAILPFYLSFFLNIDLRVLRAFRLVRFFKIARYSPALQTVARILASERKALFGALIIMVSLLLTASTLMYFIERDVQPEAFGSLPAAAWWAVATLTTVGYGDIVPVTILGKIVGGLMMIFGLGMFALPIGIFATGFTREINRREFVVTWSMVAKVPLFSKLDARAIANLMSGLQSVSFPAGAQILSVNESVDAIYFIASGEVSIHQNDRQETLFAGDFFGDATLYDRHQQDPIEATAISSCDLLMLERHDFDRLMRTNPALQQQIEIAIFNKYKGTEAES